MIVVDHRPANTGAREGNDFDEFPIFAKAFETVARPVRDEQGLVFASRVPTDAMRVIEMLIPLAAAAEITEQFPILIVMQDPLGAIAVGNEYIAIGVDGGLGRYKFF